jgi:hypothetical protein
LVGVAVNVTDCPEQIVEELAEILTAGATTELTVIVTEFEFTVAGFAQLAVEVIVQATTSLFAKLPFVYVGLLVPTLLPFSVH